MPRVGSNGAKKFGIGVRAGYLSMGSPDRGDSGAAPLVGVSLGKRGPARMSWEAGVDFAAPEAGDGTFTSTVVAGRFDLLFSLGANSGGNGKRTRPYLLSGAEALIESAEEGGESYTNYIGGLNLGVGARFGSSFDLRATYTVVVDSSNSVGLVLLTAGMSF
jgi:hypothetical protein